MDGGREVNKPEIPQDVRRFVLERAGCVRHPFSRVGICEACQLERPLELHHLNYYRVGQELDDDLLALCRECHESKHIDPYGTWHNDPEECAGEWDYYHHMTGKDD